MQMMCFVAEKKKRATPLFDVCRRLCILLQRDKGFNLWLMVMMMMVIMMIIVVVD